MNTFWTVVGASALFALSFFLTAAGGSKKRRFFAGGLGGLSLLCAFNLAAGLTGISVGLNAICVSASFLLGAPGTFAVVAAEILL